MRWDSRVHSLTGQKCRQERKWTRPWQFGGPALPVPGLVLLAACPDVAYVLCAQRAGLGRQAVTLVAVAVCAFAVASYYQAPAGDAGIELLQKDAAAHTKHLMHSAKKTMKVIPRAFLFQVVVQLVATVSL